MAVALMIGRTARFRWAVWSGWVLATLVTGCLILLDIGTKIPVWATLLVLMGFGHGIIISSLNLAVQAISKIEDVAYAVAMYTFLRSVGMSLGVSIGGTVFQNVMSLKLHNLGLPTEIAKQSESFLAVLKTLPTNSTFKLGILQSYAKGTQGVFAVMTALSGVGMLLSFLIAKHSMHQHLQSDHVLEKTPKAYASSRSVGGVVSVPGPTYPTSV
jgi:hypothetical protein